MSEPKEWLKVTHLAAGGTSVTCVLVEDNQTVRWGVKTFVGSVKAGVKEARAGARKALEELKAETQ